MGGKTYKRPAWTLGPARCQSQRSLRVQTRALRLVPLEEAHRAPWSLEGSCLHSLPRRRERRRRRRRLRRRIGDCRDDDDPLRGRRRLRGRR